MEERKLTKADIDKVRGIEGFPIAKDEDIIALSRPPYYTACPNPFIADFIAEHGTPYDEATDDYHREPFAADVAEGKGETIYRAHSYHTKVPYRAIMRYIMHYTKPGDIVFDGFCGSGMMGVAANACGHPDSDIKSQIEREVGSFEWGARNAILGDLAPIASFIASNYCLPNDSAHVEEFVDKLLADCRNQNEWMYETNHTISGHQQYDISGHLIKGVINFVVWSDVLVCPACSHEIVFWNAAVQREAGKVSREFSCPHCGSMLKKSDCAHATETHFDKYVGKTVTMNKLVPVFMNYTVGRKKYEKELDADDYALLERIDSLDLASFVPSIAWPEGEKTKEPINSGLTHMHQVYFSRTLAVFSSLYEKCRDQKMLVVLSKIVYRLTKMYRLTYQGGTWGAGGGPMNGAMYIPSLIKEINAIKQLEENRADILTIMGCADSQTTIISTQSLTTFPQIPDDSVDYIFTDPPFGANINYSELSSLWEGWLQVVTNTKTEAIINATQKKQMPEYQHLMTQCFGEYYRVLKPNHWITIEFHNSQNSVWNAIQEALQSVGFIVADVRVINKGQNSFNQTNAQGAVKEDLVISAYKPRESFVREFHLHAGDPDMAWAFVRQHLRNVPVTADGNHDGKLDIIAERQDYLLFDRMVAWHIMNGIPVPMDAHTFYEGLRQRFLERDGMFFLPDQVNEYDDKRAHMELDTAQLSFIVTDEKNAIQWLNYILAQGPMTYQEIQPLYIQELHQSRQEKMPELRDMLKENFVQDEKGAWYIPDLTNAADLAKVRRKALLKEFWDSCATGKGKLKVFRMEAIRAGFDECWKNRDFKTIVAVGERLPEAVLQEDPALLMYYDNACSRV